MLKICELLDLLLDFECGLITYITEIPTQHLEPLIQIYVAEFQNPCSLTSNDRVMPITNRQVSGAGLTKEEALYPSEIYILERNDTSYNLKHFNAIQSTLHTLIEKIPISEISHCCCMGNNLLAHNAQGAILISSVWERTVVKYGFSGYRLALIEIGIIAQQLTLILTDLGVSTLHWTSFYDDKIQKAR
ncbi:hypothetical protein ACQJ74_04345 [Helicobacter pylori]